MRQCKSLHRCRKCQKPHHTLLHVDKFSAESQVVANNPIADANASVGLASRISSKGKTGIPHSLLMTCRVLVDGPEGRPIEARALLDSASSTSFITERLAQNLRLPRSPQKVNITGIAGISHKSLNQSVTHFTVYPIKMPANRIDVTVLIVPRVTCDLPFHPVPFDMSWKRLSDLSLADPTFGQPGKIDVLFGVDVFTQVVLLAGGSVQPTPLLHLKQSLDGYLLAVLNHPHL